MEKMRVLITGVTGFVASHLVDFLINKDVEIYGTKQRRIPMGNIKHVKDKINFVDCELRDFLSVKKAIEDSRPDMIFHLAAQSFVPAGISQPQNTFEVNAMGTLNLLESVRLSKLDPIVHVASTAEVYGLVNSNKDILTEESLPKPLNLYAVSKLSAEHLAVQYFHSYGLKSIISRMLTHTGPRRGHTFVESSFAKQIAKIEAGIKEPTITVGNLKSIRTFLDIRDAVMAYWLLVNKCKPGECYNICGDATMSINELLDSLLSFSSLKDKIKIKVDKKLFRPTDPIRPRIDKSKFVKATGWKPKIDINKTLKDLLDFWREKVKK